MRVFGKLVFACSMGLCMGVALPDWLVTKITTSTQVEKVGPNQIRLTNGLIYRDFITFPGFATTDFYSFEKQQSLLRALNPEALVNLDGIYYNVGGLINDIPRGYLNKTALYENITSDPNAFQFLSYRILQPQATFPYRPKRGAPRDIVWPPAGLRLDIDFKAPFGAPHNHQLTTVKVHYEMYDGIPLLVKWVSIVGTPEIANKVQVFVNSVEYLSLNWQWSNQGYGWLDVENDIPHTNVKWNIESSQGAMPGSFQPAVNCTYSEASLIPLGKGFDSFRVHELVVGSSDHERFGLSKRRKMRLLAPHTQENPIFFHMINGTSAAVREVIDQMADVGFEMMIYSFGSGFDMESKDLNYLSSIRADIEYANGRGIEVGGYDLIVWTREVAPEWRDIGGDGACIASGWYDYLLTRVIAFMDYTGLSMVETDGPYPGYSCGSTNHSHHKKNDDSTYWQQKLQCEFFKILREREVYINEPDHYYYQGGSKTVMGYDENQFSLPRWQDLTVSRQGMFDDTYNYIPSIGWMFLPLTVYHGGGAAAQFEPLTEHILEYEWALAQYFGAGVAACYRGYRLYDSNATRNIVMKWVNFFKQNRDILTSDIIHVRRADMQGIDSFLHVNPHLSVKGLAMVFNPTDRHIITNLTIPLYYTGLTDVAEVSEQGLNRVTLPLDRSYNIEIPINLLPFNITWFLIK